MGRSYTFYGSEEDKHACSGLDNQVVLEVFFRSDENSITTVQQNMDISQWQFGMKYENGTTKVCKGVGIGEFEVFIFLFRLQQRLRPTLL